MSVSEWLGEDPQALRSYLQSGNDRDLALRRGVVGVSLVGVVAMGLVSLLQSGIVKRLPDPPIRSFKTKKVNSSDAAYGYGGPDGPITLMTHGVNMVLATTGGRDRARRQPYIPIAASLAAAAQVAVAAKYLFHQMPRVDRAWCPYCIVDALVIFATLGLTLPEAAKAARSMRRGARQSPRSQATLH